MLRALEIRDMLIIDRLDLAFQPGLNVLTGETGAGKSILLDSLGFVLGWRGRAELVRTGAQQGEVTAVFDLAPGHAAFGVLEEAGLPVGDELILRRVNTTDGRKTGWVNDRRVSGEVLRQLSATLVELHGQHDDRGLLDPKGHLAILDIYAGNDALRADLRARWSEMGAARRGLSKAQAALEEVRAEEEFLRHAVDELSKLAPEPGEEAELDQRRRRMQQAEKIRDDIGQASSALGYDGAEGAMANALRWLEGASEKADGRLDDPINALTRAMAELDEAARGVADCLDGLDFNPAELEDTEERLFALRGLARKHQVQPDELADLSAKLSARLAALDAGESQIAELQSALKQAETAYGAAADSLTQNRRAAATRLDAAVASELAPLKMERAVFVTEITPAPDSAEGRDAVCFSVATNPGSPAGPLNKIASGGELSRFLLALKVCLSEERNAGVTMIFDEIDRGVGGATADAVGRRLKALSDGGQVLVVTHSPQVAALGGHHWRVAKHVADGVTTSDVSPLDADQRETEIARMLAGDTITDQARAAARALLVG
ncbi:DNA repair protein RecN [Pelagimonas phthalicica]|uniref:DNA repair protein RecN n=1 Tax=Pelagimonas phthalicica TaxID=1037362 RepID=A0A238JDB1_9RHOB|nr:DNA repair protein RecN [Pelagimonas phthalicica]TDS93651.1 DNA replication and repair protein RecN [Pelagimonas phthalicica]SMX27826.1 DNA repair protein RecN [Pelagimonas phthalicica]